MLESFARSMDDYFAQPTSHVTHRPVALHTTALAHTTPKSAGGSSGLPSVFTGTALSSNTLVNKLTFVRPVVALSMCSLILQCGIGDERSTVIGAMLFIINILQFALMMMFLFAGGDPNNYSTGDYRFLLTLAFLFGCSILLNAGYVTSIAPNSVRFLMLGKIVLVGLCCVAFKQVFDLNVRDILEVPVFASTALLLLVFHMFGDGKAAKILGWLFFLGALGYVGWSQLVPIASAIREGHIH